MYMLGNGRNYNNLGRYSTHRNDGYGGLARAFGDDKQENYKEELQEVLPLSDDIDITSSNKLHIRDPRDFIPKPKTIVNAFEAMQILQRPRGSRGGHQEQIKGKVYWTAGGPQFSQKPIKNSKTSEKVPPPIIKLKPKVRIIRDLPTVPNLKPIEIPTVSPKSEALEGFGEISSKKKLLIILPVLGLLFLIVHSYNRS